LLADVVAVVELVRESAVRGARERLYRELHLRRDGPYPPHGIIDFLWSPFLNRAIGLGVFNLADMFWIAGIVVFFLAATNSVLTRLMRQTGPFPP
jgi:hypothetical protein